MGRVRNYRWAIAVAGGLVLVLGAFTFYAIDIIRAHQEESYRQTFRGLDLIGHDISESLETLSPILNSFLPAPQREGSTGAPTAPSKSPSEEKRRLEREARYKLHFAFADNSNNVSWKEKVGIAWNNWISATDKLTDLRGTLSYRGLEVTPNYRLSYAAAGPQNDPTPKALTCPVNDFIISQFDETVRLVDCRTPNRFDDHPWEFVACNAEGQKCLIPRFEALVPTASLVDFSYVRGLVDSVLIADAEGKVLYETESQNFVHLTSIAQFFAKSGNDHTAASSAGTQASANNASDRLFPESQSTVVPVQLSGRSFLLFVQPQVLPLPVVAEDGAIATGQRFYVVGVARQPGALENMNDLPVRTVGTVLGLLAILVISLPVIKMGLIGADEKLRSIDAFYYLGSAVLIACGVTIFALDYSAYNALREQMGSTGRAIADTIKQRFHRELEISLTTIVADLAECKDEKGAKLECQNYRTIGGDNKGQYPPYQALTVLNENGNVVGQITYRQRMEAAQNYSDRNYFRAARYGTNLETFSTGTTHPNGNIEPLHNGFFLERIRLRTTGDKLDALAIPLSVNCDAARKPAYQNVTRPDDCPLGWVASIVKPFLAFRSPVLPPFFQFAVFENATGKVIHHSDDARSLLENFYAEFSKGDEIQAAVRDSRRDRFEADGDYLGRSTSAIVQRLGDVPWSLAVFYDKNAIQSIHFQIVTISFLTMVIFALLFLMLPTGIGHYLSSHPRWAFLCQKRSETRNYAWLSMVFFVQAVFVLYCILFFRASALATMSLIAFAIWPLLYLTLHQEPRQRWATQAAELMLIANLVLSSMLLFGRQQMSLDSSTEFVIAVIGIWILSQVPALRSGLRRQVMFAVAVFATKEFGTQDRRRHFISALAIAGALIGAAVANALVAMVGALLLFLWFFLLLVRIMESGQPFSAADTYLSRLEETNSGTWNRTAYLVLSLTILLTVGVVPTVAVFNETYRGQMDALADYGQSYFEMKKSEHDRTLRTDAARINPLEYARPDAVPISVADDLKYNGIYSVPTRLFPTKEELNPPTNDGLDASTAGDGGSAPGQIQMCRSDGTFTAWIAGTLPAFNDVSTALLPFAPNRFRSSVQSKCDFEDIADLITVATFDLDTLLTILSIIVLATCALYFIVRLFAKRFLAFDIAYPVQANGNGGGSQNGNTTIEAWAEAVARHPDQFQLLIRLPDVRIPDFRQALKRKLIEAGKLIGDGDCRIESCIGAPASELSSDKDVLILTHLHLALSTDRYLERVLALLENRNKEKLPTVILSDIYPLEAITQPDQYPDFHDRKPSPDPGKVVRWIRLLKIVSIWYWPVPRTRPFDGALDREVGAFPELRALVPEIRQSVEWRDGPLNDAETVERVRQHARSFYASQWMLCNKKERVLLYRIAQGNLINPANARDLTHLLERGMLRRDPCIRLPNESIKSFILSAEPRERIEQWAGDPMASTWSIVRIPLIALIILISLIISYMGKETSEYVVALLGTAAAIIPLIFRVLGSMATRPGSNPVS